MSLAAWVSQKRGVESWAESSHSAIRGAARKPTHGTAKSRAQAADSQACKVEVTTAGVKEEDSGNDLMAEDVPPIRSLKPRT